MAHPPTRPIDPAAVPVAEVTHPLRFRQDQRLRSHVKDHLLARREERWHKLLPATLEARHELRTSGYGPRCQALALEYERVVSGALVSLCACALHHQHVVEYEWLPQPPPGPPYLKNARYQKIEAFAPAEKLRIIARGRVTNGAVRPYHLQTGFRTWPKLSERAFLRKSREWAQDRQRRGEPGKLRHLLADHL